MYNRYKVLLHVHMENTRRINRLINIPIDFQFPGLLCGPSASKFFDSNEGVPAEHQSLYSSVTLAKLIQEILSEQAKCNVIYTEFRFNAIHWLNAGVSFQEAIGIIDSSIEKALNELLIRSGCILCFNRNADPEAVESIIEITEKQNPKYIVGVDFAGDERKYPDIYQFKSAMKQIAKLNLGLTIHAGEFGNPDNIWDAICNYGATRIGHGTAAVKDKSLIDYLASNNIMLDISLTSNQILNSIKRIEDHPIITFFHMGVPVSINTDNPIFLDTDMDKEFSLAMDKLGFSDTDMLNITRQSVACAFADSETKRYLLSLMHS